MRITLCCGTSFYDRLPALQERLESLGHQVMRPESNESQKTGSLLINLFPKIEVSDAVLACNWEKKGVPGYIGGNALIELGYAYYLGKKVYLLNPIPNLSYADEIKAMAPHIVGEDLSALLR